MSIQTEHDPMRIQTLSQSLSVELKEADKKLRMKWDEIQKKIKKRINAKLAKDYALADTIRKE